MIQEKALSESLRTVLALPLAEKIGDVFESNPLLASAAAFITTRIALRSMAGLMAVGIITGSLLALRRNQTEDLEKVRKAARKAKRRTARKTLNAPQAEGA